MKEGMNLFTFHVEKGSPLLSWEQHFASVQSAYLSCSSSGAKLDHSEGCMQHQVEEVGNFLKKCRC